MKYLGVILCLILVFSQACKLRTANYTKLLDDKQNGIEKRTKITPQYAVKSRMIFKFYCQSNEKIPDCEEYDVMRIESFLEAAGFNEVELQQYLEYVRLKKAHDKATKDRDALEASYKDAIDRKKKVLPMQELEYQRMKKFYASEIKLFEESNLKAIWVNARNLLDDSAKISKYFSPEVGEIAAGNAHTCALKLNNEILCWGDNEFNQISGWKEKVKNEEIKLPVREISAGYYHSCVIGADKGISCWGDDKYRQASGWKERIANGELNLPIRYISAGGSHSCAMSEDGKQSCWGNNQDDQSLGWKELVAKGELKLPVLQISAGGSHSCAIGSDGKISCWGNKLNKKEEKIVLTSLKQPVHQISASEYHSCAITSNGEVICWGRINNDPSSDWRKIIENANLKLPTNKITTGGFNACSLSLSGEISCWGYNYPNDETPEWKREMDNGRLRLPIRKIDAGFDHSCVIDSSRRAFCWGENDNGQVTGRDKNNYKLGEFTPEDFTMDLAQLGYYEE